MSIYTSTRSFFYSQDVGKGEMKKKKQTQKEIKESDESQGGGLYSVKLWCVRMDVQSRAASESTVIIPSVFTTPDFFFPAPAAAADGAATPARTLLTANGAAGQLWRDTFPPRVIHCRSFNSFNSFDLFNLLQMRSTGTTPTTTHEDKQCERVVAAGLTVACGAKLMDVPTFAGSTPTTKVSSVNTTA